MVDEIRRELEYLKLEGSTTSAAYKLRDRTVVDFLREDLSGEITPDELWDSLGYGWTRDFAEEVLRMSTAQTNTYMVRLGQLSLGNIIALWAPFGTEECQHGPFHIVGSL